MKGRSTTNQVQLDFTTDRGDGRQFKAQLLHKNYFDLQQPKQKGASGRGHVTYIKVSPQINRAFVVIEGNLIVVHSQNLELRDLGLINRAYSYKLVTVFTRIVEYENYCLFPFWNHLNN